MSDARDGEDCGSRQYPGVRHGGVGHIVGFSQAPREERVDSVRWDLDECY